MANQDTIDRPSAVAIADSNADGELATQAAEALGDLETPRWWHRIESAAERFRPSLFGI